MNDLKCWGDLLALRNSKEIAMSRYHVAGIALLVMLCCAAMANAEIKIGMLAQRGPEIALKEWSGIGDYLTDQMGEKVTVVPLEFTDVLEFCRNEPHGFIFGNSGFYVRAKVLRGAKALVTAKYKGSGAAFGGVIFARRDSGISDFKDMKGKVLMCAKFSSAGGWLFQKGAMVQGGLAPEKDCAKVIEGKTHDEVVYAVRDKKADVGTVRTNILESMQRERKISMDDFVIINPVQHADFPEVCSTPLYPDWPLASLGKTPPEVAEKLKKALLAMEPGHPALEQARKLERFIPALDYGPLEELMRSLHVEPFRSSGTKQDGNAK
jgi:two-component system, LuxR family, sensor histidine kinase TtrS